METTIIQLKKNTAEKLRSLKVSNRESYDEIINRLINEQEQLTEEEIEEIQQGLDDVKNNRVKPIEEVARKHGVKLKA